MTIWRMRIACWITKATDTHSEYVLTHIAFPLQQWLHERASILHYKYFALSVLLILRNSEFWGRSQANTWEICGGQNGTGTGFCSSASDFPLSVSSHQFSTSIHQTLLRRTSGTKLGTLKQS